MRKSAFMMVAVSFLVTACGEGQEQAAVEKVTTVDAEIASYADAAPTAPPAPRPANSELEVSSESGSFSSSIDERPAMPVNSPKIAYVYDYGFRIGAKDISPLQQKHADMCEAMGPTNCQIMSMSQNGGEGDYAAGELRLAVASARAREFGGKLASEAEGRGGEQTTANIQGEDLSKAIVDTEARLRARTVLRDRLMEVLKTRRGTVAELVEAERGVAQVNQEIDQARSWLSEMKTRVAFSRVNIAYRSGTPEAGGFFEPIRGALGSISSILGVIVAGIIVLLAIGLPLAAIVMSGLWARRRFSLENSNSPEVDDDTKK